MYGFSQAIYNLKRYLKKKKSRKLWRIFFILFTSWINSKKLGSIESLGTQDCRKPMSGHYQKKPTMYLDDVSTIVLPFTEDTHLEERICAVTQPKFGRMQNGLIFVIEG
jgi:hypothetical protein